MDWKETYDVVVVGSGAGGLVSAITAKKNGLKTYLAANHIKEMLFSLLKVC